jgi:hypothetical protein
LTAVKRLCLRCHSRLACEGRFSRSIGLAICHLACVHSSYFPHARKLPTPSRMVRCTVTLHIPSAPCGGGHVVLAASMA